MFNFKVDKFQQERAINQLAKIQEDATEAEKLKKELAAQVWLFAALRIGNRDFYMDFFHYRH